MHKVNINKDIKTYNEVKAPVTLSQKDSDVKNCSFFSHVPEYFLEKKE